MRRLEAVLAGLVFGVFAVGAALLPLELAWFTRLLSLRFAEIPDALALPLAEASRRFVVAGDPAARDALMRVMTLDAVTHLDDVRGVIATANAATVVMLAVLGLWVFLRRGDRALIAASLRAGALSVGAFALLAAAIAVVDFDAFFAAFHGLFFAPGTWTFPADSVLIRLFPEPFWSTAGAVWGAIVVLMAGAYLVVASALSRGVSDDAQAQDVGR